MSYLPAAVAVVDNLLQRAWLLQDCAAAHVAGHVFW
jgi:hypothetical protein